MHQWMVNMPLIGYYIKNLAIHGVKKCQTAFTQRELLMAKHALPHKPNHSTGWCCKLLLMSLSIWTFFALNGGATNNQWDHLT